MTLSPPRDRPAALLRPAARAAGGPLLCALACAALILLLSQIPARHQVDLGGYDAAYVQGFGDAEPPGSPALAGSDGSARWSSESAALIFPQAGLPGTLSLSLRGWRPAGPPPQISVLLNGVEPIGSFTASGGWEQRDFPVRSGLLKAGDFFVSIRAEPALALDDGRLVGALLDRATYAVAAPAAPYPAQLIYAALAGAMLGALIGRWRPAAGAILLYGAAWLLLYRLPPPLYPYPLRGLPQAICLALAGLLALRHGPALAARAPALLGAAAPAALIGLWLAAILLAGRDHLTLSRPGVENDFRVFATRASLAQVFSADGFYNLGYPLLLWLARPLADGNAFLAGRLLAALCGAAFLAGGYGLARALLPPGPALLALAALALSGLVAQYGLYVGSDMPFAACVSLCLAALLLALRGPGPAAGRRAAALIFLAGLLGGAAFLMRHLGMLLLPWGALTCLALAWLRGQRGWPLARPAAMFAAGFLLAAAPQIIINTAQAGSPLYNQQAKNIWLAVYGGTDWGRWDEAPNSVSLADVLLGDPARFLGNWWRNLVGYMGSGAEDTSEFGRANQLRLLGWPANFLAVGGLAAWLVGLLRRPPAEGGGPDGHGAVPPAAALLGLIALYVAAVGTAFTLQRFFLPLAPIYAAAAAWAAWRLSGGGRRLLGVGMALVVVLWGGWSAGAGYVLRNQPADELAAVRMVESSAPPGALIAARVAARLPLAKYSAIAHRVVGWPAGADPARALTAADLAAARAAGASYLLWDEAAGAPPLANPAAAQVAAGGRYALYRLGP